MKQISDYKQKLIDKYLEKYKNQLKHEIRRGQFTEGIVATPELLRIAEDLQVEFCTCCGHRPKHEGFRFLCYRCWKEADNGYDNSMLAGGEGNRDVDDMLAGRDNLWDMMGS